MNAIEFAKEVCRSGFDGSDLSGAEILEAAERHGLVKAVAYDPEKHPEVTGSEYLDPGDRIYIFTEALSALPAAPMPGVKATVRPLVWEETDERWWDATPMHGLCYEARVTDRGATRVRWPENGGWEEFDGDIDAAKAVAQADYEARILSCIEVQK